MNYLKVPKSLILFLMFTSFISCKKGDVGPKGDSYDPTKFYGTKEGFFSGSLSGEKIGGANYQLSNFSFTGEDNNYYNSYEVKSPTKTTVHIYKKYAGDGLSLKEGEINMTFDIGNLISLDSAKVISCSFSLIQNITDTDYLAISRDMTTTGSSVKLSNLTYDAATKKITGSFNAVLNGQYPSYTLISAAFSSTLVQIEE